MRTSEIDTATPDELAPLLLIALQRRIAQRCLSAA